MVTSMNTQKKTQPRVNRVIDRLLAAIDRQIKAAEEVRAARDELARIAQGRQ